jgi:MinD-like ATPase involved in chromosome partitioning or flagellar assembly
MALHVLTPDVISVQMAVQLNRLLAKSDMPLKRKSHILNEVAAEGHLPQAAVERGLNTRIAFHIAYDANQARAIAQGVPLTLTANKSPLPTVLMRMAETIWQRIGQLE